MHRNIRTAHGAKGALAGTRDALIHALFHLHAGMRLHEVCEAFCVFLWPEQFFVPFSCMGSIRPYFDIPHVDLGALPGCNAPLAKASHDGMLVH